MEVATDNYGQHNVHLIEKIQNGLNDSYRINPCGSAHQSTFEIKPSDNMGSEQQQLVSEMGRYERNGVFATSFMCQWYLLTLRVIRCYSRDRTLTLMRPVIHFCIALMIGTLYYNIGDDASMMFNNFRYAFMTLMFLMYTAFCSMAVLCKFLDFFLKLLIKSVAYDFFSHIFQFHLKCQLWQESILIVGIRKKPTILH